MVQVDSNASSYCCGRHNTCAPAGLSSSPNQVEGVVRQGQRQEDSNGWSWCCGQHSICVRQGLISSPIPSAVAKEVEVVARQLGELHSGQGTCTAAVLAAELVLPVQASGLVLLP